MGSIAKDMKGGFDQFIADQRKLPGIMRVSLMQFDTEGVEWVYEGFPVGIVPPLVLTPRGGTPLWDAVGRGVTQGGERLAKMAEADRPGHVVCIIITDGEENSSREWTATKVRALVKEQQEKWKWQFQFFGANIDAYHVGGMMGVADMQAMNYRPTADSVNAAYAAVSSKVADLRASPTIGSPIRNFTPTERTAIEGEDDGA